MDLIPIYKDVDIKISPYTDTRGLPGYLCGVLPYRHRGGHWPVYYPVYDFEGDWARIYTEELPLFLPYDRPKLTWYKYLWAKFNKWRKYL